MENQINANEISGRAIGSIFFSGFGALWLLLALYGRQMLSATTVTAVGLGLSILLASAFWLMRLSKNYPKVAEDPAASRAFIRINIFQWVAGGVVAFSFARLHLDAYVPSAITAIVGMHMFPLAKLFRYPMHTFTGLALTLWAILTVLVVPVTVIQSTTGIGTGAILWASAAITQALAFWLAQTGRTASSAAQSSMVF
jgi:hypothetical protein